MTSRHGILLHVVFSTKFRKPYLADEWRDDLFGYIGGIVKDHKASLLKAGGIEDHVHLFLRIHPEFAISKTIQLLKANFSNGSMIKESCPEDLNGNAVTVRFRSVNRCQTR